MSDLVWVDAAVASELTGVRRSTCEALLRSPWLRRRDAPADGLLLGDLVLVAAADRFNLRSGERERFHARWCGDPRIEQPMTLARRRDGSVEIAAGDQRFDPIPLRARQRVTATHYSNDGLLARFDTYVRPQG